MTKKSIYFIFVAKIIALVIFWGLIPNGQASTLCHVTVPIINKDPKGINVRAAPMKNIISRIPYNDYKPFTRVHIIEANKGWLKINEWSDGTVTAKFKGDAWIYGGLVATSKEVYDKPACKNCQNLPTVIGKLVEAEPVKIVNCNEQGWLLAEGKSINGQNITGWLPPYYESPTLSTQRVMTTELNKSNKINNEYDDEGRCFDVQAYIIDEDPNGLNVRAGPSLKKDIISKIPYNSYGMLTQVDIADAKNGWLKIREWHDGAVRAQFDHDAWIYGRLVAVLIKIDGDNNIYASDVHTARQEGKFVEGRQVKVLDCGKEWLFVEGQSTYGKKVKGWLSPYGQAISPYAE